MCVCVCVCVCVFFSEVPRGHSSLAPRKEENSNQRSAAGETNAIGKETLVASHTSPIIKSVSQGHNSLAPKREDSQPMPRQSKRGEPQPIPHRR